MKKSMLLVVVCAIYLLWNSCEKDNESHPGNPAYRVIGEITWNDDVLSAKIEYIYQDEKLKTINYFVYVNPDWIHTNKEEFEYPSDDMGSFIHYYNLGGKTWKEEYKIECFQIDGKTTKWFQYHHEVGDWTVEYEEEFLYNENDLLVEWDEYDYSGGSKDLTYQEKYSYSGQQIIRTDIFTKENGSLVQYAKFDLTYENDFLSSILVSLKEYASWRENSRVDLSYLNGELVTAGISFKENGTWFQTETQSFNYDEYGNLSGELNDNYFHSDVEKTEYSYEKKSGNISDFRPPFNWVMSGYWYPQVTRSPMASPSKADNHAMARYFQ